MTANFIELAGKNIYDGLNFHRNDVSRLKF